MWRIAVVLVACSSSSEAPAPAPAPVRDEEAPPPPPPPPMKETPRATGTMHATWGVVTTVGACWYFSGPTGRDTKLVGDAQLTRDGDKVTMVFGGATFTGTFAPAAGGGNELRLGRTTVHDFDDPWTVTEQIHGPYREGAIIARYRYEECERGTHCPNHCTIDGELTLSR
jgi:hypothetical protein